jgi:hypothetical protein
MFNEGRGNLHDEVQRWRPSLVNDDLVRKVNEIVRDDRRFTISDLSLYFPHFKDSMTLSVVQKWLTSQAAAFYDEGIQKLVPRYGKRFNNGGEYVEK